jgi:predicted ATP-grasp superfamily ATP-dependent carboligase
MKSKNKIDVLVLGGHVQGLGIVRILAEKGFQIAVLDETNINLSKFSRYCHKFIKCSNDEVEEFLKNRITDPNFTNCVVFPTNDFYVELLSKNKEVLSSHLICAVDTWEKIEVFFSKEKSYRLAESISIDIAKTFQVLSIEEIANLDIKYPCIIKPTVMHRFFKKFKKKVFVCNNTEDLIAKFSFVTSIFSLDEILIQEIISGDNSCQYSVGVFAIDGKIIRTIAANRARQHPIDFGNATTMAVTCTEPLLIEYSQKIIEHTKYTGLCEIEFKKDSLSGKYLFLEVNARTWKWHAICQAAKIDLLLPYYEYLVSGKQQFEKQHQKDAFFIHELTDLPTRLKMRWKNLRVIHSPEGYNKQHAVWNKNDILPWLMEKLFLPYYIFKR